ncbi:MAG TPA: hypothetical protein VD886_02310 [Herpetosiphonaceae bacterium]|nr:hypothetical protein [Herpetosiphonaceae bacterium]
MSAIDLHVLFELRLGPLKQEIAGFEAALSQDGPDGHREALAERLRRARTVLSLLRYLRVYMNADGSLGSGTAPPPAA